MVKLTRKLLLDLYNGKKYSAAQIASIYGCSVHKVNYWLIKHNITKRAISEAVYNRKNPKGDPFSYNSPQSIKQAILLGIGMGLYWGEGTKSDSSSVRLGNSDPELILVFIKFLKDTFNINEEKLRFGLQIFSDCEPNQALKYWSAKLGIQKKQFQKVIITPSRGRGTYKNKSYWGVLTLYYCNKKLRKLMQEVMRQNIPLVGVENSQVKLPY